MKKAERITPGKSPVAKPKSKPKSKTSSRSKNTTPVKPPKPSRQPVIYLDNNGTTKLCSAAKQAQVEWLTAMANPSGDSCIAMKAKKLIECATVNILKHCKVTTAQYSIVFTSGSSESNCLIIGSCVDSYRRIRKQVPHIITSTIEHKSILKCCERLMSCGMATVTYISPTATGEILPQLLDRAIKPNTALITIMSANNELGSVNDVVAMGKIAHKRNVPFHTDAVQTFGKYRLPMVGAIDAMSISMHKLYGPMGIGLLIINNELVKGYDLTGQISGTQHGGLRGGTENVPAISGTLAAIKHTFEQRNEKNERLNTIRQFIIDSLADEFKQTSYMDHMRSPSAKLPPMSFMVLGPPSGFSADQNRIGRYVPNTLLISFVNPAGTFCNVNLKNELNKRNVIVSIGSACNTDSDKASHVLVAIRAPQYIKKGVIRISLSDCTSMAEIKRMLPILIKAVYKVDRDGSARKNKLR